MIEVSNLEYCYRGNREPTLRGVNFSVADGEVVALVGQNGSGKSTIGRLIAGIYPLQRGTLKLDKKIFDKNSNKLHKEVGIVFQNPENQIIFNRIDDEVGFALVDLGAEEKERRIAEALEQVGMSDYRERDLYDLSLGQKQRIVIAETLARRPKYLVFDEPTTMIDSQGKEEIYRIIRELKGRGYTIICITNLADEILLADRTLILAEGEIVAEIKRSELVKKSKLLTKYGIRRPTLLQVVEELSARGVKLNLKDWTAEELARKLAQKKGLNG